MIYTMDSGSKISNNLADAWCSARHNHERSWEHWLLIQPGIVSAMYSNYCTVIKFKSEADYTWFILRWS